MILCNLQFLYNALKIALLIYKNLYKQFTELTINQIFLFISYITLKLLQTFTYSWYGSLITSAVSFSAFCKQIIIIYNSELIILYTYV